MKSSTAIYYNADKSKLVAEGDPEAAFLVVSAGRDLPVAELKAMGVDVDEFRKVATTAPDDEGESTEEDEAPAPKRTSRPARSGAADKERQAPAEVKTDGDAAEDENLDDKNLAELRAIATEREVEVADDDDEDAIRVKLLDAAKPAEPQA